MWTVIYITPSERLAEQIKSGFSNAGFLAEVRALQSEKQQYEILVPESELEDVREVFHDILKSSLS